MGQTGKAWDSKPDLLPKVDQELECGCTCLEKRQSRFSARSPVVWAGHHENLWMRETSGLSRKASVRAPVLGLDSVGARV